MNLESLSETTSSGTPCSLTISRRNMGASCLALTVPLTSMKWAILVARSRHTHTASLPLCVLGRQGMQALSCWTQSCLMPFHQILSFSLSYVLSMPMCPETGASCASCIRTAFRSTQL